MSEWYHVDCLGDLKETEVLVYGNSPVLSVCTDQKGTKYLVETIDEFEGEFVIAKISDLDIEKMKNNEITMYETFRNSDEILATTFGDNFTLRSIRYTGAEIPDELLPKRRAYLKVEKI